MTLTAFKFSACDEGRRAFRRLRGFFLDERTLYSARSLALLRRILVTALIWRSRRRSRDFCPLRDFRDEGTLLSLRETARSWRLPCRDEGSLHLLSA